MPRKTWADLLTGLADNSVGAIDAADVRAIVDTVRPHTAAGAPTANDDVANGFDVGARWLNTSTGEVFTLVDATVSAAVWQPDGAGGGGGAEDFTDLGDAPSSYAGHGGKVVAVTSGEDGLEFVTISGGGGSAVDINAQTGTTYTLVLGDAGKLVTLTNGSPITLTVPTNASVAFPTGTVIALAQLGAGLVTVEGDTGVTINGATPGDEDLTGQWATASLTKLATDTWLLSGGVA